MSKGTYFHIHTCGGQEHDSTKQVWIDRVLRTQCKWETCATNYLISIKLLELVEISMYCQVYDMSVMCYVEQCMLELGTRLGHGTQNVSNMYRFKHVADVMQNTYPMCIDRRHALTIKHDEHLRCHCRVSVTSISKYERPAELRCCP